MNDPQSCEGDFLFIMCVIYIFFIYYVYHWLSVPVKEKITPNSINCWDFGMGAKLLYLIIPLIFLWEGNLMLLEHMNIVVTYAYFLFECVKFCWLRIRLIFQYTITDISIVSKVNKIGRIRTKNMIVSYKLN